MHLGSGISHGAFTAKLAPSYGQETDTATCNLHDWFPSGFVDRSRRRPISSLYMEFSASSACCICCNFWTSFECTHGLSHQGSVLQVQVTFAPTSQVQTETMFRLQLSYFCAILQALEEIVGIKQSIPAMEGGKMQSNVLQMFYIKPAALKRKCIHQDLWLISCDGNSSRIRTLSFRRAFWETD